MLTRVIRGKAVKRYSALEGQRAPCHDERNRAAANERDPHGVLGLTCVTRGLCMDDGDGSAHTAILAVGP